MGAKAQRKVVAGRPLVLKRGQASSVEAFVADAQKALRLEHWTLTLDWSKQCEKGAVATICEEADSAHATIRFSQEFFSLPERARQQAVMHELMHCHLFELQRLAEDSFRLVASKKEAAVFELALTSVLERCVDRLADVTLELL